MIKDLDKLPTIQLYFYFYFYFTASSSLGSGGVDPGRRSIVNDYLLDFDTRYMDKDDPESSHYVLKRSTNHEYLISPQNDVGTESSIYKKRGFQKRSVTQTHTEYSAERNIDAILTATRSKEEFQPKITVVSSNITSILQRLKRLSSLLKKIIAIRENSIGTIESIKGNTTTVK